MVIRRGDDCPHGNDGMKVKAVKEKMLTFAKTRKNMACFIVPMVQAIATSIYRKAASKSIASPEASALNRHIPALEKMLWGGTIMLVVDHVINGELTWRFPFFTALGQTGGFETMLQEMLSVGVPMSLVLTGIWAIYALTRKKAATGAEA